MTKRGFATYHILHNGTTINDSPSRQPNVPRTGYGIFTEYDQTTKETCKYVVPHMKNYSHDVLENSSTSKWDKVLTKTVEQVMTKDEHRAARTLGFLSEIQYAPALYFDGKVELDISFRVADCYDPALPGCRYYDSRSRQNSLDGVSSNYRQHVSKARVGKGSRSYTNQRSLPTF